MKFIARKWWFYQGWKIGENEQYLFYMAKNGFHFLRFRGLYAVFEEGEPKETRYVIKKLPYKRKLPEEEIAIYENKGWEYVQKPEAYTYIFREIEEGKGEPLYRSEEEIEYIIKSEKKNIIIFLLMVVIKVGTDIMQYSSYIKEEGMLYAITHIDNIDSILFLTILPIWIVRSLFIIYRVRNYEELVFIGKQNYQSKAKRKGICGFILGTLLPLSISLFIIDQKYYKEETFNRTTFPYPVVSLQEIETNPRFTIEPEHNEYPFFNTVSYCRYLLAPKYYLLRQRGYESSLHVEYYYLIFPQMADTLVEDLIDKNERRYTSELKEIKDIALDKIFAGKEDDRQRIYIRKGREVFFIEYIGREDAKRIIELLKQSNHFYDINR